MILADTNIIIDFWKFGSPEDKSIFQNYDVFISGITIAELMHGAKSEHDKLRIIKALEAFPIVSISGKNTWEKLGNILYILKISGITVPFQDALIATLAIEYELKLWTLDKHFKLIKTVLPELTIL